MNPQTLKIFDRRGARAVGSQPAPLLVLARHLGLENHKKTKPKNHLHKFVYKAVGLGRTVHRTSDLSFLYFSISRRDARDADRAG